MLPGQTVGYFLTRRGNHQECLTLAGLGIVVLVAVRANSGLFLDMKR